jgi:hypothetical protein
MTASGFQREVLPAVWASGLLNGDWTGLQHADPSEVDQAKQWQRTSGLQAVDCDSHDFVMRRGGRIQLVKTFYCMPVEASTTGALK